MNPAYKNLIIYYYTGTGNALKAGQWMLDEAKSTGLNAELRSISKKHRTYEINHSKDDLIGFLFPTHGFSLVPAMLFFLFRFPRTKSTVFFMNTRAGGMFFKWFTPGLSGVALLLPMLIMKIKGYRIAGARPLDMPSNWISIHPGLGPKMVGKIAVRCEKITRKFYHNLMNGKKPFRRMLIDIPIDLAIFPISLGYFFVGRFMLAKTFVYSSKCVECGLCAKKCPVQAIKIKSGKPFWTYNCESCMRCMNICPENAIEASHLLFAISLILFTMVPFAWLFYSNYEVFSFLNNYYIEFLFNTFAMIFLFVFLYFIIHPLFRFKWFNAIFRYTSFTTYWRRYRAPGVNAKDLN